MLVHLDIFKMSVQQSRGPYDTAFMGQHNKDEGI